MTTANPPAGWYEDPDLAGKLRWWDGSAWTQRRADVPPPATAPLSGAATADTGGPASGAVPPPAAPTTSPVRPASAAAVQDGTAAGGGAAAPRTAPTRNPATAALATPGERLAAFLLDGVVGVVAFAGLGVVGAVLGVLPDGLAAFIGVLAMIGVYGALFVMQVMGTGRLGQSYGKHLMRISVLSSHTGRPIGSPAAFGRGIVQTLGMYPLMLGVLWILWDPRRQGWHDKALSSIVVKDLAGDRLDPFAFLRAIFGAR